MSMFSVDINSASGANYIQPKKGAKKRVATPQVPVDLTKNGSVFNDPNIFSTTATTTSTRTVTTSARRGAPAQRGGNSIFNGQLNFISGGNNGSTGGVNGLIIDPSLTPSNGNSGGQDDLGIGRDAGKGRAAAKELKEEYTDLKSGIRGTESDGERAEGLGKKGKKLQKSLKKTDDKFKETQAREQLQFKEIEEQRKIEIQKMRTASESIEHYTQELEAELANPDRNIDRIATLRGQIREHSTTLQVGNQRVSVLGRSSKALTTKMNKTANAYIKTNKSQQKELNKNSETLEKTIEVATKIEEISTIVETTGSIIENLGKLFKACAGIPFVGAALAAAGAVMEPIGATGKMVGQWGKTAGQVVKTIAYAADGQIAMAFQSAASAVQSGMSAYSSTKAAVSGWKNLDAELAEVKTEAAEAKVARADKQAAEAQEKLEARQAAGKDTTKAQARLEEAQAEQQAARSNQYTRENLANAEYQSTVDRLATTTDAETLEQLKGPDGKIDIEKLDQAVADGKISQIDAERFKSDQWFVEFERNPEVAEFLKEGGEIDTAKLDKAVADGKISQETANTLKMSRTADKKWGELIAAKRGTSQVAQKTESKAKQILKKIFSKEGGAAMAQALSLCGMVAAQIEAPKCSSNCKKGGPVDFQMSQRAQKIVAQTMGRMRYVRPVSNRWG